MTEGRFETTYNLRPDGFDQRPFWAKSKAHRRLAAACSADHLRRESCPFHDLRAEGCFQPENDTGAAPLGHLSPTKLFERPLGRFRSGSGGSHVNKGCGGKTIPIDTEYAPSDNGKLKFGPRKSNRPWTGSNVPKIFSRYPYMAERDGANGRPKLQKGMLPPPAPGSPRTAPPPFHTGVVPKNPHHTEFIHMEDKPDPSRPQPPSRFKTGRLQLFDPHLFDTVPTDPTVYKHRKVPPPNTGGDTKPKPLQSTFAPYPEHLPDPYEGKETHMKRRPHIFTWWTHTKRSMPISNKWGYV
eukprot:PhF_6_TR27011/c0_g1_i1/m.39445